ncbi:DUF3710 domain-containing protein [Pseudonocardia sp. H11422]|uniref:DUF3710 domain-containing protein n=1 Tax=Pseudonocardia sp. H11422 TaxID=2835866 RepID=UPI001BDD3F1F|nr:DUF3710 domain-containing protein [Pseudonocardia sp. H11422]
MGRRYRSDSDDLADEFDEFDDAGGPDSGSVRPPFGPLDIDDLDPEFSDAVGRLDFGAVQLPVPPQGTVTVEPTANGRLQAVHVMLPQGRLSVSALAAPRSSGLWTELVKEIETSLREGGAQVRSFTGEWGRELHARSNGASSVFVGVDGSRWMLYGVATGPTPDAAVLDGELRRMLKNTVVVRGRSPYPPRTVLPLSLPEHLVEQQQAEKAAAEKAAAEAAAAAAAAAPAPGATAAPRPRVDETTDVRPLRPVRGVRAGEAVPTPQVPRQAEPPRAVPYRAIPYQPDAYPAAAHGAPANGSPVNPAPVNGSPVNGGPVNGAPANGTPVNGTPANGTRVNGGPVNGVPLTGGPVNGTPVNGAPVHGSPETGGPVNGTPVHGAPVHGHPVAGHPVTGPVDSAPVNGAPVTGNPMTGAPGDGAPGDGAPVHGAPRPSTTSGTRPPMAEPPVTPAPRVSGRRRAPEPDMGTPVPPVPPPGRRRAPEPEEVRLGIDPPTVPYLRAVAVGQRQPDLVDDEMPTGPMEAVAPSRPGREPAALAEPRRSRHARPEPEDDGDQQSTSSDVAGMPALAFLMGDPMRLFTAAEKPGRHRRPD